MQKTNSLLTTLCILSMVLLLGLQGYWINKYYNVTKQNFEKEVNLAFDDALKKEFGNRTDRIEDILKNRLLDTNFFTITGAFDKKNQRVIYNVHDKHKPDDKYVSSISFHDFDVLPDGKNKEKVTKKIAEKFAKMLRVEDLENHIVYYRTQELGKFMVDITSEIEFDTVNLRPVMKKYLADRNIFVDFSFYTSDTDSTTNKSTFDPALLRAFPVITHSLPTFRNSPGQNYVRVMFKDPFSYILSNMWLILSSSVLLVMLIAFCLNALLISLNKEKKLSTIKNDFISNITHEFKTPISTAMVAIEALNDENVRRDEEKTSRYLNYAKNELKRISSLTDRILKLSLYDTGHYAAKKENINVEDIIRELIAVHEFSEKEVKITFENTTAVINILADKIQFQHAISNITENAIKYGNDPVYIHISCHIEGDYFVTKVKDNGPGIPESEIPMVFEKFYRVKQQQEVPVKGYGLGLNYVKQIMKQHTGWYKLQSSTSGTELKLGWPL